MIESTTVMRPKTAHQIRKERYQVQYRSELTSNAWVDLGTAIAGADRTECIADSVSGPHRFYRVLINP